MDNEIFSSALESTLNEIKNICPDIKSTFMFTEDGEIVAKDEKTAEKTVVQAVNAFDAITDKGDAMGGVEKIAIENSRGGMSISHLSKLYLVTATSKDADRKYVNTITRVLVPTVLKLLEGVGPAPSRPEPLEPEPEFERPMTKNRENREQVTQEAALKESKLPTELDPAIEPSLPEPQATQFIVENIGGLLVPSDTVRVDNETILQWQALYDDRKIEEVEIETFGGQVTQCKVKPIKDSKYEGKGILQMPERIQTLLEIKKGELVKVKPKTD